MPGHSPRDAGAERGFTVVEALIATAVAVLAALAGLAACRVVAHALTVSDAAGRGAATLDAQLAQWRSDAAGAFAVFVPPVDATGRPNTGQEVDFFAKTNAGQAVFWRYLYDAGARTLRRTDYDPDGAAGVRDVKTGIIDGRAAYPALTGVTRFEAAPIGADRLGDPSANVYAGIGSLFVRTPQALPVRYATGVAALPAVTGGNGIIQVTLATADAARVVHLAAGSLPTGFTVTGAAVWHAVVYRVDQTHRSWLGIAGKSHVFIQARVDVSYDNWATRQTWCDINLLGDPDGLDGHDPHADYKPNEPLEQTPNILAACRRSNPQPPGPSAGDNPPDPGAIHPPLPADTPPPCWTDPGPQGRCWPSGAPPNWNPPSLEPGETPPPDWCATHPTSPACGGPATSGAGSPGSARPR